jgi:hypothetical protein
VINMALSPRTKERHERYTTQARNKLGEVAFQAAWRQGSLLTLEQAVVAALHQGD